MQRKTIAALAAASMLAGVYMTREGTTAITAEQMNAHNGGLHRAMEVRSHDVEKRTVELAFSSEFEGGNRWFGIEVLDHSPGAVQLDRLRDSGALLVHHNWDDQVGVVESVEIGADRVGRAVVRFGQSPRAQEIFQDIVDGIRKHVSVGYRVLEAKLRETREDGTDVYLITRWEPYEISIVPVPFDPTVGVGRSQENPQEAAKNAAAQNPAASSIEAGVRALHVQPKGETMNEKILRDGQGNLVRALMNEDGTINKVLEVIEKAGEAERSALASGTQAEQKRVRTLLELGDKYKAAIPAAGDLSRAAVQQGHTPEQLQNAMLDAMNERAAKPLSEQGEGAAIGLTDKEVRNFSFLKAVRALSPNASRADREAAAFEFECSAAAERSYGKIAKGILIPNEVLSRAFNAGGAANTPAGATSGANTVATQLMAGSFIEMLRNKTAIMRMATVMGGLVGNIDIPKQTGGATGYWVGEGEDATEGTPTIGQIAMSPKTVAAFTDITRRLMIQSTPDAEGIVRRDLNNALAQAIDYAGYYGSGTSNQPRGMKNYTGINAVDFAAAGAPTFAELVQMETEVAADNADIGQMGYIGHSRFRGHCKTTPKFGAGTEATIWEAGGTVNGYRAEITNQVAAGDVFFGNFADFLIGMWGGLDLTVDTSSLSKSGGLRLVVFQDLDMVLRRNESICYGSATVTP